MIINWLAWPYTHRPNLVHYESSQNVRSMQVCGRTAEGCTGLLSPFCSVAFSGTARETRGLKGLVMLKHHETAKVFQSLLGLQEYSSKVA